MRLRAIAHTASPLGDYLLVNVAGQTMTRRRPQHKDSVVKHAFLTRNSRAVRRLAQHVLQPPIRDLDESLVASIQGGELVTIC